MGSINKRNISFVGVIREWGLIFAILFIIIIAAIINPLFLSVNNFINILRAVSTIGIAAIGMAFAIMGGAMDLSLGSTVSLAAVVTMLVMNSPIGIDPATMNLAAIMALLAGICIGLAVGLINGIIMAVVNGRIGESFIITYAMQIIVAAVALIVVKGEFQAAKYPAGLFKNFGMGVTPVLMFVLVAVIAQLFMTKTKTGRYLYFLGANMDAAKMAGIKIKQVRIISHALCGICAGIAGVLIVSRVNSASALQGQGYELEAMACVAVGGTSLAGGSGGIAQTVLGVLVIGVLATALNVLGVSSNQQLIVRGVVIIAAVILDSWNKRAKLKEVA
jgi:ribose transport system permease protein